jgi:hypothetical protein
MAKIDITGLNDLPKEVSNSKKYEYKTDSNILENINKIKNKLIDKTAKIQEVANESYVDIIYYIFTVSIMCFFLYVVLADIYKTLKFYSYQNEDSQRTSFGKSTRTNQDDNDFNIEGIPFKNSNNFIKKNLDKQQNNLEFKFKDLKSFKVKNNIDPRIHASISPKNISSKYDDYEYENKKTNSSFWDLLFKKPKYPSMTNESSGSFFEFI